MKKNESNKIRHSGKGEKKAKAIGFGTSRKMRVIKKLGIVEEMKRKQRRRMYIIKN